MIPTQNVSELDLVQLEKTHTHLRANMAHSEKLTKTKGFFILVTCLGSRHHRAPEVSSRFTGASDL